MTDKQETGRSNQRRRTRKDLLQATARLLKQGQKPSLGDVAKEALVSRATAYRYFPSMEALLVEASLDVAVPAAEELFGNSSSDDAVERLDRVEAALHEMIAENEVPLRMMLAQSLERRAKGQDDSEQPIRQNRRTPLIQAALQPAKSEFDPANLAKLSAALALILGTESMVVFRDVLQLNDSEAHKVRRWAIRALVEAARREAC